MIKPGVPAEIKIDCYSINYVKHFNQPGLGSYVRVVLPEVTKIGVVVGYEDSFLKIKFICNASQDNHRSKYTDDEYYVPIDLITECEGIDADLIAVSEVVEG
jgi:hypothetical protein